MTKEKKNKGTLKGTKTFKVSDEQESKEVAAFIDAQLIFGGALTVSIKTFAESRNAEQNRLLYKWLGEISYESGDTKEGEAINYKELFLVGIYKEADKPVDVEGHILPYKEFAKRMNEAVAQYKGQARYMFKRAMIAVSLHTSDLDIPQFAGYLRQVRLHAQSERGIMLTDPSMRGLIDDR